jgi:uracil-DNA glycosylase
MPSHKLIDHNLHTHIRTLPAPWQNVLLSANVAATIHALSNMLASRDDAGATIYPNDPFRALRSLNIDDIKVVILGQDPYHGPGQAQGMAFSVPDDFPRPPSLRNIFLEIDREFPESAAAGSHRPAAGSRMHPGHISRPAQGRLDLGPAPIGNDLSRWAAQGVLLLNTVLTVEDGMPASHAKAGWETVTDALIEAVATEPAPKVFMLWGNHAQAKRRLIENCGMHLVLTSNHPSPLSARRPPAPFLGCGHFQQANAWLAQHNRQVIDWKAPLFSIKGLPQAKKGV